MVIGIVVHYFADQGMQMDHCFVIYDYQIDYFLINFGFRNCWNLWFDCCNQRLIIDFIQNFANLMSNFIIQKFVNLFAGYSWMTIADWILAVRC